MRKKHLKEEENIRLQQAELMALFASLSPDLILRFDINGIISLANNSAHREFKDAIVLGGHIKDALPVLGEFDLEQLVQNGEQREFSVTINEKCYQFILAGVPKFAMCQLYGRDITELKEKETALKAALEKAEESEKLKADFLARISHEIRSPLVAIQGYSELLMSDYADKFDTDFISIFRSMDKNSKRLYRTLDLILNMSQLTTSKYEPSFQKINLDDMLKVIHSEFYSFAEEKKVEFSFNNNSNSDFVANVDAYSVQQIFNNLVDNAIKFTPKGKVAINLFEENNAKCVEIADTGIGISEKYIGELFSAFSQEQTGYTRAYEGTGLGLALVKNYADINNATIIVKSSVNSGSSFTLKFEDNKNV